MERVIFKRLALQRRPFSNGSTAIGGKEEFKRPMGWMACKHSRLRRLPFDDGSISQVMCPQVGRPMNLIFRDMFLLPITWNIIEIFVECWMRKSIKSSGRSKGGGEPVNLVNKTVRDWLSS